MLSGNKGPLCPLPLLVSRLLVASKEKLVYSSGSLILANAAQETPQDHLILGTNRAYTHRPTRLYIFADFKSCCLGFGFQSARI